MGVIGTKVLRVFLLGIHCQLHLWILFLYPWAKVETGIYSNVNIENGNLKSENSQDYAQKPQQNCEFMNSASVDRADRLV